MATPDPPTPDELLARAEAARTSDIPTMEALARQALEVLGDSDEGPETARRALQASVLLAISTTARGRNADAIQSANALLRRARALEDRHAEARLLNLIGVNYDLLEQPDRATPCMEEALRLYTEQGSHGPACHVMGNLAVALSRMGEDDRALQTYERAFALADQVGAEAEVARHYANAIISTARLGRLDEAVELERRAEVALDRAGMLLSLPYLRLQQARLRALELRWDEAIAAARDGLSRAVENGQLGPAAMAHASLAELLRHPDNPARDPAAAVQEARRGLEIAERVQSEEVRDTLRRGLAEALEASGDLQAALTAFKRYHTDREASHRRRTEQRLQQMRQLHRAEELERRHSELSEINRGLEALYAQKGELVAVTSHDLRSPLTAVTLIAGQLMESSTPATRATGELLQLAAARMRDAIENLVSSHEIETGDRVLRTEPVGLQRAWQSVAGPLDLQARAKGIALEVELCDRPVRGDRSAVEQVLSNLVANALKFSAADTTVTLRAAEREGVVRIEVLDQGPGLTALDFERVFQKYARLSARPTAGEPSSGLGLFVCRTLVERMGGTLEVENRASGGARFWLDLPAD